MFFKTIDKFFDEIKKILSAIILAFIAMAIFMFIYWILYLAKINLPDGLNNFAWGTIDFFFQWYKSSKQYEQVIDIMPALCSVLFGAVTYFLNCTLVYLENNHKKFQKTMNDYRLKLEKDINTQLHKDFLDELKKSSYMLVKISIEVQNHESYLTAMTDENLDIDAIKKEIEQCILAAVKSDYLSNKGRDENGVYFLLSNIQNSRDFFTELVQKSSQLIKTYLRPKMTINFFCGAELFNDASEFQAKSDYLDRVISLKIPNKIVITPRYKLYFENLFPSMYAFKVLGEYNLNPNKGLEGKNTMLYSMQRR